MCDVRHPAVDGKPVTDFDAADIDRQHDRQDQGELHRRDATSVPGESAQARKDALRIAFAGHWYGSFLNVDDAMIRRVPFDRLDKLKPSGPSQNGHWYITRTTTICPAVPGLNCQVLVTCPDPLNVRVGVPVAPAEKAL